jgi:hypothetical protein
VELDSPSCTAKNQEQSVHSATCGTACGLSPEAETMQQKIILIMKFNRHATVQLIPVNVIIQKGTAVPCTSSQHQNSIN